MKLHLQAGDLIFTYGGGVRVCCAPDLDIKHPITKVLRKIPDYSGTMGFVCWQEIYSNPLRTQFDYDARNDGNYDPGQIPMRDTSH